MLEDALKRGFDVLMLTNAMKPMRRFEPELLAQLRTAGVMPGAVATLSRAGNYVLVQVDGHGDGLELPHEVASHVYVAA